MYKFNIINFYKQDSSYNQGLKVLCYSSIKKKWFRVGENVCYYQNNIRKAKGGYFYTMTFSMEFEGKN